VQVLDELGLPSARTLRVGVDVPGSPFVLYVVHGLNPLGETSFDDHSDSPRICSQPSRPRSDPSLWPAIST
jgi:hypothetical protein